MLLATGAEETHHLTPCDWQLGLGIGCNFMIDNQLQPTDRLLIIISLSHFCSNWVLEVYSLIISDSL